MVSGIYSIPKEDLEDAVEAATAAAAVAGSNADAADMWEYKISVRSRSDDLMVTQI